MWNIEQWNIESNVVKKTSEDLKNELVDLSMKYKKVPLSEKLKVFKQLKQIDKEIEDLHVSDKKEVEEMLWDLKIDLLFWNFDINNFEEYNYKIDKQKNLFLSNPTQEHLDVIIELLERAKSEWINTEEIKQTQDDLQKYKNYVKLEDFIKQEQEFFKKIRPTIDNEMSLNPLEFNFVKFKNILSKIEEFKTLEWDRIYKNMVSWKEKQLLFWGFKEVMKKLIRTPYKITDKQEVKDIKFVLSKYKGSPLLAISNPIPNIKKQFLSLTEEIDRIY